MRSSRKQFIENMTRARDLRGLYVTLGAATTQSLDLTDLLRAAIVQAVSAFDTFIHEVARIGVVEVYQGARPWTDAFGRFTVTMGGVQTLAASPNDTKWLEDEVRRQHNWLSFQHPDKVADAIRLFCDKRLWDEVGVRLGIDAKSAKTRLSLIVDRRSKIAHEADMDPSFPGLRWPIDEVLVRDALDTIESIANAIYDVITTP